MIELTLSVDSFWVIHIYFKTSNIHGNYNSVLYINIIELEGKHYSLFASSLLEGLHHQEKSQKFSSIGKVAKIYGMLHL